MQIIINHPIDILWLALSYLITLIICSCLGGFICAIIDEFFKNRLIKKLERKGYKFHEIMEEVHKRGYR